MTKLPKKLPAIVIPIPHTLVDRIKDPLHHKKLELLLVDAMYTISEMLYAEADRQGIPDDALTPDPRKMSTMFRSYVDWATAALETISDSARPFLEDLIEVEKQQNDPALLLLTPAGTLEVFEVPTTPIPGDTSDDV